MCHVSTRNVNTKSLQLNCTAWVRIYVQYPRLFHSIEKLDNRSRPHSRHGDRQPNPHYRMAQDSGLSFFIRTTYARCELIFRSGVLRGLKQYKFCLCCIYIREKRGPRLHALYFELFVSIGFFEKPAKPTGKNLLETCTQ